MARVAATIIAAIYYSITHNATVDQWQQLPLQKPIEFIRHLVEPFVSLSLILQSINNGAFCIEQGHDFLF